MNFKTATLSAICASAAIVAAAPFAASSAQAATLNCDAGCLLNQVDQASGNSFVIDGTKQYSDFLVSVIGDNALTSSTVKVLKSSVGSGIAFQFGGLANSNKPSVEILLEYTLTALGGSTIKNMNLSATGNTSGTGFFTVAESLFDISTNPATQLGTLSIDSTGNKNQASLALNQAKVRVQKDIILTGGSTGADYAHLSIINQVATSTAIPTPALLPGLVGMGIAALRRQRKQTADQA